MSTGSTATYLWSVLMLLGIPTGQGVLEWNLCDEGMATFDTLSVMGKNTRAILHVFIPDTRLSSCQCTLTSTDGEAFNIQYTDDTHSLRVDTSCHLAVTSCSDTLLVKPYDWSGQVTSLTTMNVTNTWAKRIQRNYMQYVERMAIVYVRAMGKPVSVKQLSLNIGATKHLNVSCTHTLASLDVVYTQLNNTTTGQQGGQAVTTSNQGDLIHSKFTVILVAVVGVGVLVLVLVILVTAIRHRKAKERRATTRRMNPVYRPGASSRNPPSTRTSTHQPTTDERYVSLETMQEVNKKNAPPTIHNDFTISFGPVTSDDHGYTAIPEDDLSVPASGSKHDYKNIPVDDGYQSTASVSHEGEDSPEYINTQPAGNQTSGDKYYALWGEQ